MPPEQLAAALAVCAGAAVGLVEALKPWIPEGGKPLTSILVGIVLAVLYIALPAAYQPIMLMILSGAVGTAGIAVASKLKPEPTVTVTTNNTTAEVRP